MEQARLEIGLLLLALLLGGLALRRWRVAVGADEAARPAFSLARRPAPPLLLAEDSVSAAADLVIGGDPFRLANAPTSVPYDPATDGAIPGSIASPTMVPVRVRPALVLRGVVGGPPWQAIIDGFPGQPPGAVVAVGMTFDKLLVKLVTRDSVVVQGPDTSWTLTIGRTP